MTEEQREVVRNAATAISAAAAVIDDSDIGTGLDPEFAGSLYAKASRLNELLRQDRHNAAIHTDDNIRALVAAAHEAINQYHYLGKMCIDVTALERAIQPFEPWIQRGLDNARPTGQGK